AEIHKNKSNELSSLVQELSQTQPTTKTLSQQSSPLELLESHLQGELPQSPEPRPVFKDSTIPTIEDLSIPTTKVYDNIFSSFERLVKSNTEYVIRSPEPEIANSEPVNPEVEFYSEAIEIPSELPTSEKPTSEQSILNQPSEQTPPEQPTSEHHTEPIPDQISEKRT
ncbi:hypothetical protein A2U01_0041218, partial [Trifolium medium]|nr:hypothetical protein [Trifolium medium]